MMYSSLTQAVRRSTLLCSSSKKLRLLSTTSLKDSYENIQVERRDSVGLIRLHRPKAMNALSDALFADLLHAAKAFDQDETVGCLVLTGSQKAFAAGADISEMKDREFDYTYKVSHRC
jgi:enoyl-CoA hydratase/carnithine racemase